MQLKTSRIGDRLPAIKGTVLIGLMRNEDFMGQSGICVKLKLSGTVSTNLNTSDAKARRTPNNH